MNTSKLKNDVLSRGFSRRDFVKYFTAGSAVSIASLSKLNASIYQSVTSLNQKYIRDESPDGVYWDALQKHYLFQRHHSSGSFACEPNRYFCSFIIVRAKSVTSSLAYI